MHEIEMSGPGLALEGHGLGVYASKIVFSETFAQRLQCRVMIHSSAVGIKAEEG